ncbi:dihydrolipoyl dehydrogenase [Allorhodopirellula heiligendammensis]|uniref:Dihydrolipoyl dehydrogenase n=1 Tax=Allorhodopirellula heiligendammensis TaxID=2714739 RepID=A0A5C6BTQ9_9BACT|nr:dihydrolipoyl dehydrogenase [Allorhodopirellula heiligendammensis]TWU15232.1 Dihydrolipoyl dehydrogenase [Allorhodopirellula heiligendammensis]
MTNTARHELVVLGGGPAGYVAAIRAAQLGIDVACIDENPRFGGTCLRVGCIPSKALLESSHVYEEAQHRMRDHGVKVSGVELELDVMMSRKEKIVDALTGGIDMLFKKGGVTAYRGRGKLHGAESIEIAPVEGADPDQPKIIEADQILLCPGSIPARLPSIEEDGDRIGNSTTALSFPEVPEILVVIGGGYIGLELGSVWNRLGSRVIVLEALDRVLPGLDNEMANLAHRAFKKQGIEFRTSTLVSSARVDTTQSKPCTIEIQGGEPIYCDRVLLATGRWPATDDLGLAAAGVQTDRRGFIEVNENFQTSVPGVYAIGDCIGGAMLAHKAMEEGIVCVERMAGIAAEMNYDVIPAVVYTHPEIAMVGQTEEQLKEAGIAYKKGVCPLGANGRARTLGDIDGRVKILADEETDRVLGVHIIGPRAGDLIAEAAAAMEFGASSEEIARTCHAHPTLSEAVHEAALAVDDRAIHTA